MNRLRSVTRKAVPLANQALSRAKRLLGIGYRKDVLAHMEAIAAERPLRVSLETITVCNAKCVFCAYRKTKRKKSVMTMDLFERICADFASLGGGFMGFSPLLSDPLVDPRIFDRIRHARDRHPGIKLNLFTNGILLERLSDDHLTLLVDALDHMDISLGGVTREDYQAMFGVDRFDRLWRGLERLSEVKNRRGRGARLKLHFRTHRKEAVAASEGYRALIHMGFEVAEMLDRFANWTGIVTAADIPAGAELMETDNSAKRKPCLPPFTYLNILADGRALGCMCMDWQEQSVIGNVNDSSLAEVWTGEAARRFRFSFPEAAIHPLCRHCSYYSAHDKTLANPGLEGFDPTDDFIAKLV